MKRLLLDTNIYGLLATDSEFPKLYSMILEKREQFLIYGFVLIRKELKDAPGKSHEGKNIRASLLHAYERMVSKEYPFTVLYKELAEEYYLVYHALGGSHPKEKLFPDSLIVACASAKQIPLVVSEDSATLGNEIALKAYSEVNLRRKISLPILIRYKKFKEMIRA